MRSIPTRHSQVDTKKSSAQMDLRGGGHAWSVSTEAASEYLRARIPFPQYLIDYCFAYHELSGRKPAKWDAVLDLGCGPGQLAVHMNKRFKRIYGRDTSQNMIDIAKTLTTKMDDDELKEVGLFKPASDRIFDFALGSADALNMPNDSVDMIIIGSANHWFDWSTKESSTKIWQEWTRVLRPNGSILIISSLPAPGSSIDTEIGMKARPLRQKLRNISHSNELSKYYSKTTADLGTATMNRDLIMPWQLGLDPSNTIWDQSARYFCIFDHQDPDVAVDGFPPLKSDPIPAWMPNSIARYITTDQGIGDAYEQSIKQWKTTTPRRMAVWVGAVLLSCIR
jgi:ubiquinone/menaquinone biosynthesis C-methylase UbiE